MDYPRLALPAALLLVGLTLAACRNETREAAAARPAAPPAEERPTDPRLAAANNDFGLRLLSEIRGGRPDENVFLSPLSLAMALQMVVNGAEGETRQAMAGALGLSDRSLDEINKENAALIETLSRHEKVRLSLANALWADEGTILAPGYAERIDSVYGARLGTLDFQDPGSAGQINRWVAEATAGKIDEIVDPESLRDVSPGVVLTNAVYFKGDWAQPFDKALTRDRPFHRANGQARPHPSMEQSGEFRYLEGPGFQAIRLPYAGGQVSMVVTLPSPGSSLDALLAGLTAGRFEEWREQMVDRPGRIVLPRFRIEYDARMKEPLSALGMGIAFDRDRADFTGLVRPNGYIAFVRHRTFVEVDEQGTEAAGATSVGVAVTAAPAEPEAPFTMVVDRPFFCAIVDETSGAILFAGVIHDPR